MTSDLTVLISTFERPAYAERCLASVRAFLPDCAVMVADDSREPLDWTDFGAARSILLPFDSGLSAKRNALLGASDTKYVLFLDDDTYLTHASDTDTPMAALRGGAYDMVGGVLAGRKPYCCLIDVQGGVKTETHGHRGQEYPGIWWCDLVENCLFARSDAVFGMGGWDEELKLGEHGEFFLRTWQAKNIWVGFCPTFQVGHDHALPVSDFYREMRSRHAGADSPYTKLVKEKHGLRRLVVPGGAVFE